MAKTNYKVLTGIDYLGKRAEAGDVVSDLPKNSVAWLLRDGIIERVAKTEETPIEIIEEIEVEADEL
jgi:hypothetical protein